MTPAEFAEWEPNQPLRFDLVDGIPVPRPERDQVASRLARVRKVAAGASAPGCSSMRG